MLQKTTVKQRVAIIITILWVITGLFGSYKAGVPMLDIPSQFHFGVFLTTTVMPLIIIWGGYWIWLGKKK